MPHEDSASFTHASLDGERQTWLAVAGGAAPSALLERSPQTGSDWQGAVERLAIGAQRSLQLGYPEWAEGSRTRAERRWRDVLGHDSSNARALHPLAPCTEDGWEAFDFAERAHEAALRDDDLALRDDDLLAEYYNGRPPSPLVVLSGIERLSHARVQLPRVRVAHARSLVAQGHLAEARANIDTLVLPNLRELSVQLAGRSEYAEAAGIDDSLPEHLHFPMADPGLQWAGHLIAAGRCCALVV